MKCSLKILLFALSILCLAGCANNNEVSNAGRIDHILDKLHLHEQLVSSKILFVPQTFDTQAPPQSVLPVPQPHWLLLCLVSGATHFGKQAFAFATYS